MRQQLSTPSTWGAPKTLETAGGTGLDWVIYIKKKKVNKGKINNIFKKFKSSTLLFKIIYAHFCPYSKIGDLNGLHSYSAYPVIRLLNAVTHLSIKAYIEKRATYLRECFFLRRALKSDSNET